MSESEQILIVVKTITTKYEYYKLDEDELRQYLSDSYPNEPRIQTIRLKLWKWLKGFTKPNKPLFISRGTDSCEIVDEPIEDNFNQYGEVLDNKIAGLLNPRRTLQR
jgi:hypothetical protein